VDALVSTTLPRAFAELLAANARFAEGFEHGHLPPQPARRLVLLTCMDARIDPRIALGLDLGDTAVLRNAGARASGDAVRSVAVAVHALGARAVAVMHHTDCGMATVDQDELVRRVGTTAAAGVDFLTIADPGAALRADVEALRRSPLVPDDVDVAGFRYDVETGRVTLEVRPAP
jgi:carbonic anhydrase